jgi:hypothetical protein
MPENPAFSSGQRTGSRITQTKLHPLALGLLVASGPGMALDSGSLTASVLSPGCLDYQVVGICFWLLCTQYGCEVHTSTKVRHFIPELVVSSYASTGDNPWTEMAALSSPVSGAEGGGNLITPNTRRDNLPRFKNVDGIGHPGGWAAGRRANSLRNRAMPAKAAPPPTCPTTSAPWTRSPGAMAYRKACTPKPSPLGCARSAASALARCGATSIPATGF